MQKNMNKSKSCNVFNNDFESFCNRFIFNKEINGRTILVTGGTGLIGSYVLRFLRGVAVKNNLSVKLIGMARNPQKVSDLNFTDEIEWIYMDLNSDKAYPDGIDYIIHTACPTQSQYLISNPVEVILDTISGTRKLLDYCRIHADCSMVYISSVEVYGQIYDRKTKVSESDYGYIDNLNVRSCYPESKRLIECLCSSYAKEYGVRVMIARLTQTIGSEISADDKRVFVQFAKSALKGEDIILHTEGKSSKSYLYITDAVLALMYILLKGQSGRAYNVANEQTYISIYGLAEFVIHNFNNGIKVVIDKSGTWGYAPDTMVDLDTAELRQLGWNADVGLYDMFFRLIESIKSKI